MSRPEVVRPFSGRKPMSARSNDMYSARNQFNAVRNSREPITIEDIISLKREKQNLTQERYLLKAKLARFSDASRRPNPPNRNIQISNSLEKEIKTLETLMSAKKEEINELIYSDRASMVTELQEESKMLTLESQRLKKVKVDTEAELKRLSMQLEEACEKYSPQVLSNQNRIIKQLEKKIKQQTDRNNEIQKNIDDTKRQFEEQNLQQKHDELEKRISDLRQQIKQVQDDMKGMDNEMKSLEATHANDMLEYQSKM